MFANWLNLGKEGSTAKAKSRIWYFIGDILVKSINKQIQKSQFWYELGMPSFNLGKLWC